MLHPCVGREQLQGRLRSLLPTARWVTLTGPPGSGKSLLARHAAQRHRDVVWLAAGQTHSLDGIVEACLAALGADLAPGDVPAMALKRALDGRDVLLVLDGVDSVPGLGSFLEALIQTTSTASVLCTALTMAGQPSEQVLRVGPLPVPGDGEAFEGPAVELFLTRLAAAGGHPLDLRRQEQAVRELLHTSGGLPLLIEQLAVQAALVGMTDVVPTTSLDAAVAAAYRLLDADQQQCFRRLSLLEHRVSLEVLAELLGPARGMPRAQAAQLAAALVRRSLIEVQEDGRFGMLPPVRRHASTVTTQEDRRRVRAGLLRWAERVTPADNDSGAGDAPWLPDLALLRSAIAMASRDASTRPRAYQVANRAFSSLYTTMRAREALDLLETVLDSGDGPGQIGAQVARRAGICASEVRGTFEGLKFLDRAEQHALALAQPEQQLSRNAGIRAEMFLDAGQLGLACREAQRAATLGMDVGDHYLTRQARRTLLDALVCLGDFDAALRSAEAVTEGAPREQQWMALSAMTLLARIAFEQGRPVEAAALTRSARDQAETVAEDRVALLADTLHRRVSGQTPPWAVEPESLPWAVRLTVQLQQARELLGAGEVLRTAGIAADITVLADRSRLARDAVEARLLVGDALLASGDPAQAGPVYLAALAQATSCPLPLRAADALDGLAAVLSEQAGGGDGHCAGAASALRRSRRAVPLPRAPVTFPRAPARACPSGWVVAAQVTPAAVASVSAMLTSDPPGDEDSPLGGLTTSERSVARLVAEGLTNRQIGERLFISPRTVDAHLAHIFRKLGITSRSRLAALIPDDARRQ